MRLSKNPILSPWTDFFMLGGLSILFVAMVFATGLQQQVTHDEALIIFFSLSFFINLPHFASTYILFYKKHAGKILERWSWKLVGIVLPALMLIYLFTSYALSSWKDVGHLVTLMFYLVGWHYVKQVFGCIVVISQREGYALNAWQRKLLKINLLALWLTTLSAYSDYRPRLFYNSLSYAFYYLPNALLYVLFATIFSTAAVFLYISYQRFKKENITLPAMIWVPWFAVYLWFMPFLHQQIIFLALPLFHALQYLLFVIGYNLNEHAHLGRAHSIKKAFMFLFFAFLMGAFFMEIFPRTLDLLISLQTSSITIFLVMFNVFINIHHYLMDFVLWRNDVPEFKKYILDSN